MSRLPELDSVFRGMFLRDLRPVEGIDGVCVGYDVRIHRDGKKYIVRFSNALRTEQRDRYLQRLANAHLEHRVGDDFEG